MTDLRWYSVMVRFFFSIFFSLPAERSIWPFFPHAMRICIRADLSCILPKYRLFSFQHILETRGYINSHIRKNILYPKQIKNFSRIVFIFQGILHHGDQLVKTGCYDYYYRYDSFFLKNIAYDWNHSSWPYTQTHRVSRLVDFSSQIAPACSQNKNWVPDWFKTSAKFYPVVSTLRWMKHTIILWASVQINPMRF